MADAPVSARHSPPAPDGAPRGADPPVETEAKLRASRRAFRALDGAETLAGWRVTARHDLDLRDTYWDTPAGGLAGAGCTLRVREQLGQGEAPAELTFKGPLPGNPGGARSAVWRRSELTVDAPAGSGPREWARLPGAAPVMEALGRLDAERDLRADVVLRNPRRELVLESGPNQAVLSLDEVEIEGQPYRRRYVEVELKRGSADALEALVDRIAPDYGLRPSRQGKVQAARAWLARRTASG
jgi:inorganic triphosphatase YgiF